MFSNFLTKLCALNNQYSCRFCFPYSSKRNIEYSAEIVLTLNIISKKNNNQHGETTSMQL